MKVVNHSPPVMPLLAATSKEQHISSLRTLFLCAGTKQSTSASAEPLNQKAWPDPAPPLSWSWALQGSAYNGTCVSLAL